MNCCCCKSSPVGVSSFAGSLPLPQALSLRARSFKTNTTSTSLRRVVVRFTGDEKRTNEAISLLSKPQKVDYR